jgi:hypothetical protein
MFWRARLDAFDGGFCVVLIDCRLVCTYLLVALFLGARCFAALPWTARKHVAR